MLLHSPLLRYVEDKTTEEQYIYLKTVYSQDRYMLDDQSIIAPLRFNLMPRDVRKTVNWINEKIVLNLPSYLYFPGLKTIGVLLRIATGMINKLDLPDNIKMEIHNNVISHIYNEIRIIDYESVPF